MRILEQSRVIPSSNSPKPSPELSLPLTFSDLVWLKLFPVERIFFYELNELTLARFNSEIIPKLKQSLSLTLHHYLPLAGNIKWPSDSHKPIISYTPNDSVSLTVAVSNSDFNVLSSNGVYEAVELHHLIPELITSDDSASTIGLQITLFPDKGFCIGIAAHHGVLDGKTTTMFIKSWAHICSRVNSGENSCLLLPPELAPVFDRGLFKYPDVLDDILLKNFADKSLKILPDKGEAENLVRSTVEITREDLKKLRERALRCRLSAESGDKTLEGDNTRHVEGSTEGLHLSNFVLVYAYITTCIVRSRGGNGDRNVGFAFLADCRARIDPPLPDNYFGNCNTGAGQLAKARDFLDENGFVFGVEKISDLVKEVTRNDVIDGMEKKFTYFKEMRKEFDKETQIISVAGSPRFDVYGSDFGWGKPVKVVVVSIDKNKAISLAESRDGNRGVEIGLALEKHEMDHFSSLFLKDFQEQV